MRISCLLLSLVLAGSSIVYGVEAVGAPGTAPISRASEFKALLLKGPQMSPAERERAVKLGSELGIDTAEVDKALQANDPTALASVQLAAAASVQDQPELKALQLGTSLVITPGGTSTGLAPLIEAYGTIGDPSKPLYGDLKLSIKGVPASSADASALADEIRLDAGTISLNAGVVWAHFSNNPASQPLGIDMRAAVQASYQQTPPSSGDAAEARNDFAIVAPEIRLAAWLKYAYVGYKWNYSRTFGKSSGVADELDRSSTHKFFVAVRLSNSQSSDGDFYIEGQYTGGRNTLQGGTFSLAITRTFNRPW